MPAGSPFADPGRLRAWEQVTWLTCPHALSMSARSANERLRADERLALRGGNRDARQLPVGDGALAAVPGQRRAHLGSALYLLRPGLAGRRHWHRSHLWYRRPRVPGSALDPAG